MNTQIKVVPFMGGQNFSSYSHSQCLLLQLNFKITMSSSPKLTLEF